MNPYVSPPFNHTATSKLAALSVEATAPAQCERVLAYVREAGCTGLTREEIAAGLELRIQSVCARVAQLLAAGTAHEPGLRRKTSTGRQAKVVCAVVGQQALWGMG